MKKTLKDLEAMKNKSMIPFGSQYEFLFATLEDYYIAKMDGVNRIKDELNNWDVEAQKVIANKLIDIISESGIIGFDKNEILSLIGENIIQEVKKWNCYIEEYKNAEGKLCARLRDKDTNKKVIIVGTNADKNHLLRFMSQAKINLHIMPTVFDKNGTDIIAVRGYVDSEDEEEIVVNIDVETGGYLFE